MSTAIRQVTDADRFTEEQLRMITDTIMKGATQPEVEFFAEVCKRARLDPFKRQIHAVKRWDNDLKRMVWSYQTGIDGYRAIAQRTGTYAGSDEPKFLPEDESTPNPRKATVTVWKIVAGQRVPFTSSARWEEYVQTKKDGEANSMWKKMPYGQLAKCAEALALRKAFPEELGGIHTDVEMEQADSEGERGQQVKGTHPGFDLESKPFEKQPAKFTGHTGATYTEGQVGPDPKPAEKPTPAAKQEDAQVVEAEVVDALAVPGPIAKWTRGKWKDPIGALKGKALAAARDSAFATGDPEACAQACASIYDEVQARIATKNLPETEFADLILEQGIEGIEFPADLWSVPSAYPSILELAKHLP